jgi:hypothetical protein
MVTVSPMFFEDVLVKEIEFLENVKKESSNR